MFKNDKWIREKAEAGMITPFVGEKVRDGVISYGLGHYGYDLRLSLKAKIYRVLLLTPPRRPMTTSLLTLPPGMAPSAASQLAELEEQMASQPRPLPLNPKNILERQVMEANLDGFTDEEIASGITIPAGTVMLGSSLEYLKIPENVLAFGYGKSTYARCGLFVEITPIEPGWEGNLTISMCNCGDIPVLVYPNEGIAQIVFFECDERPEKTYADLGGKYQATEGAVVAKV